MKIKRAKPGQKVAVTIEQWEDESLNPEGRVVKVLAFLPIPASMCCPWPLHLIAGFLSPGSRTRS